MRDIRLSRFGVLVLAAISLAATIVILAGGGDRTDAQLAAETALRHPLRTVEQVQTTPATSPSGSSSAGSSAATGGGANISPPVSDSGSTSSASGDGSGATSSGTGSSAGSQTSSPSSSGAPTTSGSGATTTSSSATTTPAATDVGLPRVGHVFLLTLSTARYRDAFAASSQAPYLRSLARRGTVLSGFHSLGRGGLADLLAMVSGQPPNRDTLAGCPKYVAYPQSATLSAAGVAKGTGCVYPDAALTVADQVNAAGKTWGAYVADMGASNCPVPTTGAALDTPLAGTQEGYDVANNPFAFFGSLLDEGACSEYDQDLTNLTQALAKKSATPSLTYVGADACVAADPTLAPTTATGTTTTGTTTTGTTTTGTTTTGTIAAGTATTDTTATTTTVNATPSSTASTVSTTTTGATTTSTLSARLQVPAAYGCPAGEASGIAGEDAFLKTWVPKILSSPAYKANGVLVIAFTGATGRATADTGALVLSRWTPRHKRLTASYSAYSLLHSIEDMLDLQPLAKAAAAPAFAKFVLR